MFAQIPYRPSSVFVKGKREREKKKKTTLHIKESFEICQWRNIPATATKALQLCVRTSHAQLETAWRRHAVSSFLHFSIRTTSLEFWLLIGSSLGRLVCQLCSLVVEQDNITVTQLIGYRLVAFFFHSEIFNVFWVLCKVQRLVHVPKKLCSCAKANNWVKVSCFIIINLLNHVFSSVINGNFFFSEFVRYHFKWWMKSRNTEKDTVSHRMAFATDWTHPLWFIFQCNKGIMCLLMFCKRQLKCSFWCQKLFSCPWVCCLKHNTNWHD